MRRVRFGISVTILLVFSMLVCPLRAESGPSGPAAPIIINARQAPGAPPVAIPRMGGTSPSGHSIGVNSRYLILDGKPWLPVMGEFHFSRYPAQYWEEELLKMKAGGVEIVSNYVFWIHHEEIEGHFDWSGQRDLRRFIELCGKHKLYVFLRIGPYAHGEVRNGGLPDWVLKKSAVRRNNPVYLAEVRTYYGEISRQVKGLWWKDGGPIIGVQYENEYSLQGPGAGAEHISELRRIARQCGMEAPLSTVTGWDKAVFPPDEVIPVFGAYPDGFWWSSLDELPPSAYYLFEIPGQPGAVGGGQNMSDPENALSRRYPSLLAEAGGGMEVAYHRRPVIAPDDVAAITLTHLGDGANLYGYYMFQGGANPPGKQLTLEESQASDHTYDLPVVSYDFQAPLGEFGQMRPVFRTLKMLHLFLQDFGGLLAPMMPILPHAAPKDASDFSIPRVAARAEGDRAFVFFNNYERGAPLPEHRDVQVRLELPSETLLLPRTPFTLPSGAYFIWPVNLDMDGVLLKYATAQLLTKIRDGGAEYYFFFAQTGIPIEFALDRATVASMKAVGSVSRTGDRILVGGLEAGTNPAMTLRSPGGKTVRIVVLNRPQAENLWKASIEGREHLFLSPADLFFDEHRMHVRARDVARLRFAVFPDLTPGLQANAPLARRGHDGIFAAYAATVQVRSIHVSWRKVKDASPSLPVQSVNSFAVAPVDRDFDRAAVWRISLPADSLRGLSDVFLRIDYAGDVGRLYRGRQLLDDDFYKGTPWEIGLKRFAPEVFPMNLEVMPLRKDAPLYIPAKAWPAFPPKGEISEVLGIAAEPEYEVLVWRGSNY